MEKSKSHVLEGFELRDFTGNYTDLVNDVNQFLDETAYQLCGGFAVHNRYVSLHPKVAYTFAPVNEGVSSEQHPLGFALRIRSAFRELVQPNVHIITLLGRKVRE